MLLGDNGQDDVLAWLDMSYNAKIYASTSTHITSQEVELHMTACNRLSRPACCNMLNVASCMLEDRHPGIPQVRLAHVSVDK